MGLIPKWVWEFPGQFWATLKENASENLPEFRDEVIGGVKAVIQVPAKIVEVAIKPLNRPLIIVGVLALILLIFWKKLTSRIL
ncbi:hypothetical protein KA005_56215 [bacterium]|nr:hypothetical protein [bacterium]